MGETQNGAWIAVASLAGNATNRSISIIKQTSDNFTAEIMNARGGCASLGEKLSEMGVETHMIASLATEIVDDVSIIMPILANSQTPPTVNGYYAVGTESPYAVYQKTDDGFNQILYLSYDGNYVRKVNIASIINSVNDSDSSIAISADKIAMTGTTTFLKPTDLGVDGSTTIDGSRINTGYISADRIAAHTITLDKLVTQSLTANSILVKDIDDKVLLSAGDNAVTVGGFTITDHSIYRTKNSANSTMSGVYIGNDGIALGYNSGIATLKLFQVTAAGVMSCSAGSIGGWVINSDYLKSPANTLYLFSGGDGTGVINNTSLNNLIMRSGTGATSTFGLTADGKIYCSDVNLSGTINATSGYIGGWEIGYTTKTLNSVTQNYPYLQYNNEYNSTNIRMGIDGFKYNCMDSYIVMDAIVQEGYADADLIAFNVYNVNGICLSVIPNGDEAGITLSVENGSLYLEGLPVGQQVPLHVVTANGHTSVARNTSAARYKECISVVNDFNINDFLQLQVKSYKYQPKYSQDTANHIGFIADDVAIYYPQAAIYNEHNQIDNYDDRAMIAGLMMTVQYLYNKIEQLQF